MCLTCQVDHPGGHGPSFSEDLCIYLSEKFRAFPFGNEGQSAFVDPLRCIWKFPFREPQEVPLGNGMRVLTDMLVSVLYHASSNVTLSDLGYMSVTCSTWSGTGEFTTQRKN